MTEAEKVIMFVSNFIDNNTYIFRKNDSAVFVGSNQSVWCRCCKMFLAAMILLFKETGRNGDPQDRAKKLTYESLYNAVLKAGRWGASLDELDVMFGESRTDISEARDVYRRYRSYTDKVCLGSIVYAAEQLHRIWYSKKKIGEFEKVFCQ